MMMKRDTEPITPDRQARECVEREHPNKPDHEKWRLAQTDTLIHSLTEKVDGKVVPVYIRKGEGYVRNPLLGDKAV